MRYDDGFTQGQQVDNRLSKSRREATMGSKRMIDRDTGQTYDVRNDVKDPTVGGWRKPRSPTELLDDIDPNN